MPPRFNGSRRPLRFVVAVQNDNRIELTSLDEHIGHHNQLLRLPIAPPC